MSLQFVSKTTKNICCYDLSWIICDKRNVKGEMIIKLFALTLEQYLLQGIHNSND